MEGVKGQEDGGEKKKNGFGGFEEAGRDGVWLIHEPKD
jgi:hypothetical protein